MTRSPYDQTPTFYPEPWEDKAACLGHKPAIWDDENQDFTDTAKKICAECPVRMQCLTKGMREKYGIFGGLTAEERKAISASKKPKDQAAKRAAIGRLNRAGYNDQEIATTLGISHSTAGNIRRSLNLPVVGDVA